jgi:hypothetical protein
MRGMCARLVAMLDVSGWGDHEIGDLLGYSGQGTISSVRKRRAFLDTERLATFGRLRIHGEANPNLHWVLTGEGEPFFPAAKDARVAAALSVIVRKTSTMSKKSAG